MRDHVYLHDNDVPTFPCWVCDILAEVDRLEAEQTASLAEVRRLRDVLHDLDDFTARHSGPSRFGHDHVCYEAWMLLHDSVGTLIGDDRA